MSVIERLAEKVARQEEKSVLVSILGIPSDSFFVNQLSI